MNVDQARKALQDYVNTLKINGDVRFVKAGLGGSFVIETSSGIKPLGYTFEQSIDAIRGIRGMPPIAKIEQPKTMLGVEDAND